MSSRPFRTLLVLLAGLGVSTIASGADTKKGTATPANSATKAGRGAPARGPLPDPALLDGSTQQADKQSENGMLGEFELPGDENVRNGKVGGPEQADPASLDDPSLPQNGGSRQGTQAQGQPGGAGGQPGGREPPPGQQGNAPAGAAGGQQPGGQIAAAGDPSASAQGIQVAELQGEPQGGGPNPVDMPQKPPPVAIGDSAMQIQGVQNAPGVVGGQVPATQTQQMEKAVGGGAKGASGSNGNKGAEKGRAMPSGL